MQKNKKIIKIKNKKYKNKFSVQKNKKLKNKNKKNKFWKQKTQKSEKHGKTQIWFSGIFSEIWKNMKEPNSWGKLQFWGGGEFRGNSRGAPWGVGGWWFAESGFQKIEK